MEGDEGIGKTTVWEFVRHLCRWYIKLQPLRSVSQGHGFYAI